MKHKSEKHNENLVLCMGNMQLLLHSNQGPVWRAYRGVSAPDLGRQPRQTPQTQNSPKHP